MSPGIGFGHRRDEHVRFALVENEQRIRQAVRGMRAALALNPPAAQAPADSELLGVVRAEEPVQAEGDRLVGELRSVDGACVGTEVDLDEVEDRAEDPVRHQFGVPVPDRAGLACPP